jgi:hypothetical protein
LMPALPVDLVHLVLDYAPGVALEILPMHERIEVVRRLTGLTLSDERASLVLEQRDANNRDFDDLTLAADDAAWIEALWSGVCSPRAFDELVRVGEIKLKKLLIQPGIVRTYVVRALEQNNHYGLALVQHMARIGLQGDILLQMNMFESLAHVTHPPTVQYLVHRLLDEQDPSFTARKTFLLRQPYTWVNAFLGETPCSLDFLVLHMMLLGWYHSTPPLFEAIVVLHPKVLALCLHLKAFQAMTNGGFFSLHKDSGNVRPPGKFGFSAVTSHITYGTVSCAWRSAFAMWVVDDWLAQAQDTNQWVDLGKLLQVLIKEERSIGERLIQGVPDAILVQHLTQQPELLHMFYTWQAVPACLLTLLPFDAWMIGLRSLPNKKRTDFHALRFFGARQRLLLMSS